MTHFLVFTMRKYYVLYYSENSQVFYYNIIFLILQRNLNQLNVFGQSKLKIWFAYLYIGIGFKSLKDA